MRHHAAGAIAMAAYKPDPELFTVQLRSIQAQEWSDFQCVISCDSDADAIESLKHSAVGGDSRFSVHGDGRRRGFYLNFERALELVPREAAWVALADQDDRWYPHKLSRLVPELGVANLAAGQARVVRHPDGAVLLDKTPRREVAFDDLIVQNQVTGAQSVFRRDLLDLALPFPRVDAVTAVHDHWLAICASVVGSIRIVDEVVQDYVQHGRNVIGEVSAQPMDIPGAFRRIRELALEYEGGASPLDMARVCNRLAFGWRRAMLTTVSERLGEVPTSAQGAWLALGPDHANADAARFLTARLRSPNVDRGTVFTFLPGVPLEVRRRTRSER
ncbi:glycosyltransferase [Phycicoccus sp. Root101]|uniref:glycosyltransferase n=1 Tax=Phycicoccus sp. Root101 TaxID=1736421 RepID=UPI000702F10D|nr:glycosyltransferase [Phycicoccus sp. Root101]KQU69431.1 hypothetical protein ASC58_06005 [Phycicoccus sp. Root101]